MQTKGTISKGSALVMWDYYLTVQDRKVIRRDISAKIIDESACLCLDAVLICRKQRKKINCKQNTEAAAKQRQWGK